MKEGLKEESGRLSNRVMIQQLQHLNRALQTHSFTDTTNLMMLIINCRLLNSLRKREGEGDSEREREREGDSRREREGERK